MKKLLIFVSCIVVGVLTWHTGSFAQDAGLKRETRETLLVDLARFNTAMEGPGGMVVMGPDDHRIIDMKVSPDLRSLVLIVEVGHRNYAVVHNGKMYRGYDGMGKSLIRFSPDGTRMAYSAVNDKADGTEEWFAVVDGEPYGPYSGGVAGPYFSEDGRQVAYITEKEGKRIVIRNFEEDTGQLYDKTGGVRFSPDGSRLAFTAMVEGKMCKVVDGEPGPGFDKIDYSLFSPDSRRHAYRGILGEKVSYVIDGVSSPAYEKVTSLTFSPDSKHVCFGRKLGGEWRAVIDGKEGPPYDDMSLDSWYSPDSKRQAYWARRGNKHYLVIDGVEKQVPGVVQGAAFSPDSRRISCDVWNEREKKGYVVVDDNVYGPYAGTETPLFSPDSGRAAFMAFIKKKKGHVVLDGVEGKTYKWVGDMSFSPDSRHLAYGARGKGGWFVVLDGEELKRYKEVGSIMFSPDSRHLLYGATDKSGKQMFVVDGVEGRRYDGIMMPPTPEGQMSRNVIFDTSDGFHYLAMKGNEAYLVEEKLVDGEAGEGYNGNRGSNIN